MGVQPDNDDIAAAKDAVKEAKRLDPKNETVMIQDTRSDDLPLSFFPSII
jgi:hypothetical protein